APARSGRAGRRTAGRTGCWRPCGRPAPTSTARSPTPTWTERHCGTGASVSASATRTLPRVPRGGLPVFPVPAGEGGRDVPRTRHCLQAEGIRGGGEHMPELNGRVVVDVRVVVRGGFERQARPDGVGEHRLGPLVGEQPGQVGLPAPGRSRADRLDGLPPSCGHLL